MNKFKIIGWVEIIIGVYCILSGLVLFATPEIIDIMNPSLDNVFSNLYSLKTHIGGIWLLVGLVVILQGIINLTHKK